MVAHFVDSLKQLSEMLVLFGENFVYFAGFYRIIHLEFWYKLATSRSPCSHCLQPAFCLVRRSAHDTFEERDLSEIRPPFLFILCSSNYCKKVEEKQWSQ